MLTEYEIKKLFDSLIIKREEDFGIRCDVLVRYAEKLLSDQSVDLNKKYKVYGNYYTLLDAFLSLNSPRFSLVINRLLESGAKGNQLKFFMEFSALPSLQEKLHSAYHDVIITTSVKPYFHSIAEKEITRDKKNEITKEQFDTLIKRGYPINAVNSEGKTAAEIALETKNYTFLLWLVEAKADLTIQRADIPPLSMRIQEEIISQQKKRQLLLANTNDIPPIVTAELFEKQLYDYMICIPGSSTLEKLQNLLRSPQERDRLFSDKLIISYLARENFSKRSTGEPVFSNLEELFYKAACLEKIELPYRGDPDGFYQTGTKHYTRNFLIKKFKKNIEGNRIESYSFIFPRDLYGLSENIYKFATLLSPRDSKFHYLFSATKKDDHIFASLTLLNLEKHKPHCTIFFNSWSDKNYFNAMKSKFNIPYSRGEVLEHLSGSRPPVLDGSLNIQITSDDHNCTLYTLMLLQSIYKIITNSPYIREQLEQLPETEALAIVKWDEFLPHLTNQIQKHLPEFFQPQGNEFALCSHQDRKKWCIEKRFQIGQEFILSKHQKITQNWYADLRSLDAIDAYLNKKTEKVTTTYPDNLFIGRLPVADCVKKPKEAATSDKEGYAL